MVNKDSLASMGGFNESSITEDWDLASRLTEKGYRIVFDESISVPAECPSTFRGLVKQQMRWAEGIVRDTKNNFLRMLRSKKANLMKKFDYLFYGFSSLNGVMGSISYILTAFIFLIDQRIIITLGVDRNLILGLGIFGQFLLFVAPVYIPLALVFAALVGLYRENELSRLPWCVCLFVVSLTLAPFIAYAGIKGLLFKHGSWARTPKTGEII
jgi:cellulose synthase/poly-beta-1,6-N-acetylglucosamine synthase-like glycosyltransferase